jgi:EAL and modified HD-GYP domain-containing signal transduction protein
MTTDSATEAYVSRQPIYRTQLDLFGYELLFRDGVRDRAVIVDGDRATAAVILNFFELGMERIVGKNRAFINLTRNFILDGHCASLPHDRVVLEVLEDVTADPEVVRALRDLSAQGYTIALDDFIYEDSLRPLVEVADIVKVDVLGVDRDALARQVSALSRFQVRLLAEKVETQEQFEICKDLGFEYFQGFFFCKPKLIHGKQVPTNRLAAKSRHQG